MPSFDKLSQYRKQLEQEEQRRKQQEMLVQKQETERRAQEQKRIDAERKKIREEVERKNTRVANDFDHIIYEILSEFGKEIWKGSANKKYKVERLSGGLKGSQFTLSHEWSITGNVGDSRKFFAALQSTIDDKTQLRHYVGCVVGIWDKKEEVTGSYTYTSNVPTGEYGYQYYETADLGWTADYSKPQVPLTRPETSTGYTTGLYNAVLNAVTTPLQEEEIEGALEKLYKAGLAQEIVNQKDIEQKKRDEVSHLESRLSADTIKFVIRGGLLLVLIVPVGLFMLEILKYVGVMFSPILSLILFFPLVLVSFVLLFAPMLWFRECIEDDFGYWVLNSGLITLFKLREELKLYSQE